MAAKQAAKIEISPPNFKTLSLRINGTSPLMMHKFSAKMRRQIEEKQTATSKISKRREPKDYEAEFNAARYISDEGWDGVPAGAIRASMIAACRKVQGLPMTQAKGAFFIIAQGHDKEDRTPLIRIHGKPVHDTRPVRLESGVADLRNRPRYDDWFMEFAVQFDADMLSGQDVCNLLARAGAQVGIGELRPQGPNSYGGDFGCWQVQEGLTDRMPSKKAKKQAKRRDERASAGNGLQA